MRVCGADIGGAHIKVCSWDRRAIVRPFALWRAPERLEAALEEVFSEVGPADAVAVTLTGEICDCFASRAEGVRRIVECAVRAAGKALGAEVRVWTADARFVSPEDALRDPDRAAAQNWFALASWLARRLDRPALLADTGSTTTDLALLAPPQVAARGRSDRERLESGELVYTGCTRTPLCAVAERVCVLGREYRVAAEVFGTALDVYLLTGDLPESPGRTDTADGRPWTRADASRRLARMILAEPGELGETGVLELARAFARAQVERIREAAAGLLARASVRPELGVVAGSGEFIARRALSSLGLEEIRSLAAEFSPGVSEAACAAALVELFARPGDRGVSNERHG